MVDDDTGIGVESRTDLPTEAEGEDGPATRSATARVGKEPRREIRLSEKPARKRV